MPANKFVLPTGYEDEQRKAERKRKIAQMMLEKGLANNPNMQNWTQVLAQVGEAWAGKRLDKKADQLDSQTMAHQLEDYKTRNADFDAATGGANVDPAAVVRQFSTDPYLQDRVKPYADAMAAHIKESQEGTNFGGQWRLKGQIQPGEFEPNKPTDSVLRDGSRFVENPVRTAAALHAQGYDLGGPPTSMPAPMAGQQFAPPVAPPSYPRPAITPGDEPNAGALDTSLLSPEERQIMASELARRAGHVSSGGQYELQNDMHTPMGNPLTAKPPPAGVTTDGRPYWMVNGVAYDNPEGR